MNKTHKALLGAFAIALAVIPCATAQLPAPKPLDPNPWNGSWKLSVQRSSAVASQPGVPQVYRFSLGPAPSSDLPILWEIQELGEVVAGRTKDIPMPVMRSEPSPGLKLAVRAEGPASLVYTVFRNSEVIGGGRLMLIDKGAAWVDLTWPADRQDLASALVYVRE